MSDFMPIPPSYAVADPQVRAILDALTRNVQVTIDSIQSTSAVAQTLQLGGTTTFGSPSNITNVTNLGAAYTPQNLKSDLASGAVAVIAGAMNSNSIIKTYPTYMAFQHKDAVLNGTSAAYTGDFHTGLGITSTGIVAGYNNKTTGVWQTTLAIESATGNLTVLGTIKANSVIQVGAYLGSQTVSSVLADVSNASANASYAASAVGDKLSKSGADILSGNITFTSAGGFKTGSISIDGSGNVTGAGVAFTSKGIVGRNASNTTFTLDATTGSATFSGDIVSSGKLQMQGSGFTYGGSTPGLSVAYIDGTGAIYGAYVKGGGVFTTAIAGESTVSGGTGVSGASTGIGRGVYGFNDGAGNAVLGINTGTGPAVNCFGPLRFGSYTISTPDGGIDKYLRNDGVWAPISGITAGVASFNSRTGAVTLSSGDVTGALGYTPYNSSNPSGYITSSALSSYSTTAVTLAYLASFSNSFSVSCTFPGVGFSVSGSGTNSISHTIFQTSDRSLKKDIVPNTLGMAFIRRLEPVTYYYADNTMFGFKKKMYGLIANEVMDVAGEESSLVYVTSSGPLEGKLAADYASYVAPIITALKEIDARLAQLEANNA